MVGKKYLLNLYNTILDVEMLPREWARIKMFFLYKKGDREIPGNYRGIALINNIVKIFTRLLEARLTVWAEKCGVLSEGQNGFRKGRNCLDNIFVLQSMIYYQIEMKKRKLYGLFIDFESAFDSVPHALLWRRLGSIGKSSKIIRILGNIYKSAAFVVEKNGEISTPIQVSKGVLQGDSASPLLFSLYISDIETFFREKSMHGIYIYI
jgi:hypothetical protein